MYQYGSAPDTPFSEKETAAFVQDVRSRVVRDSRLQGLRFCQFVSGVSLVITFILFASFGASLDWRIHFRGISSSMVSSASSLDLALQIKGDYDNSESSKFYPGWRLVEPHRVTTLTLRSTSDDFPSSGFDWTISERSTSGSELVLLSASDVSRSVEVTFTSAGVLYEVRVTHADTGLTFLDEVTCKYVRRELRRLLKDDRTRYLDALKEIFTVSQADGEAKYGSEFVGIAEFTKRHMWKVSMEGGCSPWHFSMAFCTFVPTPLFSLSSSCCVLL